LFYSPEKASSNKGERL